MKSIIVRIGLKPLNNPDPKTPTEGGIAGILNVYYYPNSSVVCKEYKPKKRKSLIVYKNHYPKSFTCPNCGGQIKKG